MRTILLAAAATLVAALPAPGAPPTLTHLLPSGAPRGRTVEVSAVGSFDPWPVRAWVQGRGVAVEPAEEKGTLRVTVADDAPVGLAWIRLYNAEGASALRPFVVGTAPEVAEVEPNDDPSSPQAIDSPTVTINGRLERNGDVDGFGVALETGQTLVASMVANNTLGSPMDGTLQVASPEGFVLAHVDDDQGLDPLLVFTAPQTGTYIVRTFAFPETPTSSIRFAGGDDFVYRLTLTTGAFADHAFPLAVSRDAPEALQVRGWNLPDPALTLPVASCVASEGQIKVVHPSLPVPIPVPLVPHPVIAEPEEGDVPGPVEAPTTVSGHIDPPGDRDLVRFEARKGEKRLLRATARGLGSPLDPVLRVLDSSGKELQREDDSDREHRDVELIFEAPQDGEYQVEVSDLNDRGGWRYAYRLDLLVPEPDFRLTAGSDRHSLEAGKPLEIAVAVDRRHGFDRPIEIVLEREGLPVGIQAPPVTSLPEGDTAKAVTLQLSGPEVHAWSGPFRIVGRDVGDSISIRPVEFTLGVLDATTDQGWLTVLPPREPDKEAEEADEG